VAAFGENVADVPPESAGRPGNRDLHDVLLHEWFVITAMTGHRRGDVTAPVRAVIAASIPLGVEMSAVPRLA